MAQAVGAAAILHRSAEILVEVSHALVMQWILSHRRGINLAKGCNSLSFAYYLQKRFLSDIFTLEEIARDSGNAK